MTILEKNEKIIDNLYTQFDRKIKEIIVTMKTILPDSSKNIKTCKNITPDEIIHEIETCYTNDWVEFYDYNIKGIICSLNKEINTNDMTIVNIKYEKNGYLPPHTHDRIETVYVISGSFFDECSDKTYNEGDSVIIQPGTIHSSRSDNCLLTVTWRPAFNTLTF
jgi:mannose-6-phosphate isomerase-like protein (cupin superfamily)